MTKCTYKNGKKEGLYVSWYENNNQFQKIWYKADKRHGLYESWYNDGKRDSKTEYLNGIKHGMYEKYENEVVIKRHRYINGIPVSRAPIIINLGAFVEDWPPLIINQVILEQD
jgi:antitoxin component YwqK of YwqJK toxin-antitoxin module